MVWVAVSDCVPARLAIVQVLALAVFEFAERTAFIQSAHFARSNHVAVVFRVVVNFARLFHRFDERDGFGEILHGHNLAQNVLAVFQTFYGIGRVLVGIVCEHYRVHVRFEQILEIFVIRNGLVVQFLFHFLQRVFSFVAYRRELNSRVVFAIFYHCAAAVNAQHSYFNGLFHGFSPLGFV